MSNTVGLDPLIDVLTAFKVAKKYEGVNSLKFESLAYNELCDKVKRVLYDFKFGIKLEGEHPVKTKIFYDSRYPFGHFDLVEKDYPVDQEMNTLANTLTSKKRYFTISTVSCTNWKVTSKGKQSTTIYCRRRFIDVFIICVSLKRLDNGNTIAGLSIKRANFKESRDSESVEELASQLPEVGNFNFAKYDYPFWKKEVKPLDLVITCIQQKLDNHKESRDKVTKAVLSFFSEALLKLVCSYTSLTTEEVC